MDSYYSSSALLLLAQSHWLQHRLCPVFLQISYIAGDTVLWRTEKNHDGRVNIGEGPTIIEYQEGPTIIEYQEGPTIMEYQEGPTIIEY